MLTDRGFYQRIDSLVDRAYIPLMIMLVGYDLTRPDYRDQLEEAHRSYQRMALITMLYVLLRNRPPEGYQKDAKLNRLLDSIAGLSIPILNDAQQATLDTAAAAMMDALESTKQEIKKQLRQKIVEINRQHRQDVAVNRVESVSQVQRRKDLLRDSLIAYIPTIMTSAQEVFERSFGSALTDTINDVVVDAATAESLFTGVPPSDVIVFKKVVDDESLCRWCRKFYQNPDGSPVLFTLAELQANGSNYGKPKSEWKPTIGKTHVRCRCMLFHRQAQK